MVPDTGQLATAVFAIHADDGGGTFQARMKQIGELQRTIDALETSHLTTEDEKSYIPGDLVEPGEIEMEFFWNGAALPPDARVRATLTVTLPAAPDQSAAASWVASGFFTLRLLPSAQLNTIMMGKTKFKLDGQATADGGTKFTFTPATVA
ncbi:hypothetical protein [Neorhodopirellula pilleata]|uniref:Uncharacterized protein n=1 Tax=Neorhodopirellula pilleata TaxID=2714738 RepID=A0A5C5ZW62_9BACT|nr:hypothetical protein [Neorhodopirellula pilleata]TWT91390.1 hypothetical protein Pla100_52400 [Neorhodopirellula pilleata]TWT91439.1 hypothetical protein Pla100_52890 [Neorhodopirellula pilleata]